MHTTLLQTSAAFEHFRSTHANSRQQSFWYVGTDDTDQERDSREPRVSESHGNDKENDGHRDRQDDDDVDEMLHFSRQRRRLETDVRRQIGNATHHR